MVRSARRVWWPLGSFLLIGCGSVVQVQWLRSFAHGGWSPARSMGPFQADRVEGVANSGFVPSAGAIR